MYCALQVCILLLYKRTAWSQLSFNYFFNIRKTFNKKEAKTLYSGNIQPHKDN